ncbi:MAG: hypothetical protein HYV28_11300 [Ignavibacteriales bacterium]|nr:hypothetical protein [Ignavibacteriales bacterium]
MVDTKIINLVKKYLNVLSLKGIFISKAFVYGRQTNGTATGESDIDLMLVSPMFAEDTDKYAPALWLSTRNVSYKIRTTDLTSVKKVSKSWKYLF